MKITKTRITHEKVFRLVTHYLCRQRPSCPKAKSNQLFPFFHEQRIRQRQSISGTPNRAKSRQQTTAILPGKDPPGAE